MPHRICSLCISILLGATACGAEAAPPPKDPSSAATATATPAPPPRPLERTDAFFVIDMPASARPAAAAVCTSDADCTAKLPPDHPSVVGRFGEESWVVITAPTGYVAKVASDGTTANVTLEQPCPGPETKYASEAHVILYRVARSVTNATVRVTPPPQNCTTKP